jgi:hypothetical protein
MLFLVEKENYILHQLKNILTILSTNRTHGKYQEVHVKYKQENTNIPTNEDAIRYKRRKDKPALISYTAKNMKRIKWHFSQT